MEKLKEIDLYIKQSRHELEEGVWDGDPLMIFYMLEYLQTELASAKDMLEDVQEIHSKGFSNIRQRHLHIRIREFIDNNEDLKLESEIDQIKQLQAKNKQLKETIKDLKSGHFCPIPQLAKSANATCDCAHSDRHRAIDWATIDKLEAENKLLQARLEPAEFFLTEVLSLEQVLPLDLRNEANIIIDKVMAEIGKWESENKQLKENIRSLVSEYAEIGDARLLLGELNKLTKP